MKKLILILSLLLPVTLTSTGCKSSPTMIAYKSADAVVSSVDVAMMAWADYVVAERLRINDLPPIERGSLGTDLLRKEGKVQMAHGRYRDAMRVSRAAVNSAIQNKERLPDNVGAAAAELLTLIRNLKG